MSHNKIKINSTNRHSQFTYIQSDIQLDIIIYDIEIWNYRYSDIQFDWDICKRIAVSSMLTLGYLDELQL